MSHQILPHLPSSFIFCNLDHVIFFPPAKPSPLLTLPYLSVNLKFPAQAAVGSRGPTYWTCIGRQVSSIPLGVPIPAGLGDLCLSLSGL